MRQHISGILLVLIALILIGAVVVTTKEWRKRLTEVQHVEFQNSTIPDSIFTGTSNGYVITWTHDEYGRITILDSKFRKER